MDFDIALKLFNFRLESLIFFDFPYQKTFCDKRFLSQTLGR